jgi:hypothetical protein
MGLLTTRIGIVASAGRPAVSARRPALAQLFAASAFSSRVAELAGIRRRHSLRASANSHGRSLEGSGGSLSAAMTNVSRKASAAEARSCSIQWQ